MQYLMILVPIFWLVYQLRRVREFESIELFMLRSVYGRLYCEAKRKMNLLCGHIVRTAGLVGM